MSGLRSAWWASGPASEASEALESALGSAVQASEASVVLERAALAPAASAVSVLRGSCLTHAGLDDTCYYLWQTSRSRKCIMCHSNHL